MKAVGGFDWRIKSHAKSHIRSAGYESDADRLASLEEGRDLLVRYGQHKAVADLEPEIRRLQGKLARVPARDEARQIVDRRGL